MAGSKIDPHAVVTQGALAALLGLTVRHVASLGERGILKSAPEGGYHLTASVHGYLKFLKESAKDRTKTASHSRLQDARVRALTLRTARDARQLIETSEAVAVLDEVVGVLRAEVEGAAAAATRDLTIRRKFEKHLNDAFARAQARILEKAAALETAGEGADQGEPDD
jgi:hypothetical protein